MSHYDTRQFLLIEFQAAETNPTAIEVSPRFVNTLSSEMHGLGSLGG